MVHFSIFSEGHQHTFQASMTAESPFKRKKVLFQKEDPLLKTALQKGLDQLDSIFLDAIPSEEVKQLPPSFLYPVGLLIILVLVAIFIAIFVPGYTTLIKTKFLSPVDSGETSNYCDDVTISNTGNYLATKDGAWQGSTSFAYSNATYSMTLANVGMDQSSYAALMSQVFTALSAVGTAARSQNLGQNLLYWMSWVFIGASAQRFTLTGTPLVIFDTEHTVGTVSNVNADCNATSTSTFNPSTGVMQVTYGLQDYTNNPTCSENGSPAQFGYSSISRSSAFSINFDIRTLITVVAINNKVTDPLDLQLVDHTMFRVGEDWYYSASFVDPRYPGMEPTLCLFDNDRVPSCLLSIGSMYALPVFNHIGASYTTPGQCNCTTQFPNGNTNYSDPCNQFNFLTGFVYWPASAGPLAALELVLEYSPQQLSDFAYLPMYVAGAYGVASPERDSFNSPAQRADMYDFCNSATYGPCSIATFSSFDASYSSHAVSTNFYTVVYGACTDTMSATQQSWDNLVSTPFTPLTQQYQTCSNDPVTAFFTQVGVSAGNVTLYSPAGVLLVLYLLGLYQYCTGRYIPRTYSSAEKSAALEALAVAMLLVRDKRVKAREARVAAASTAATAGAGNSPAKTISNNTNSSSKGVSSDDTDREADQDAYEIGLLTELVDQLGNIAPAAESQHYLYREEAGEVVKVDWNQLSAKITGKSVSKSNVEQRSASRSTISGTEMMSVDNKSTSSV